MKLSVIIVNYNVKFFLEQCLYSVFNALKGVDGEVIVVDNCSVDGSEAMVRTKFPEVNLFVNKKNIGFAKANNQGISQAKGDYVLLLNPDTVVEESTFNKCIAFMDLHPDAGALGCKMIDGKGRFLPESKRSLPTPQTAFFKIFGLTRLFPKSPVFARYYVGNTSKNLTQSVDVLTGAFLFFRKIILDKTGLLDETYFMFGEDIDFSYRITQAGYKNYYFPEATIIHYKGESTKKGSINYVLVFYEAMRIFVNKYFTGGKVRVFSQFIHLAIYLVTVFSILKRSFQSFTAFFLDLIMVYGCFYSTSIIWARWYFKNPDYYPGYYLYGIIPCYAFVVVLCINFMKGYWKKFDGLNIVKAMFLGLMLVLVIHALLPVEFRFSRAVLVLGGVFSIGTIVISKYLFSRLLLFNFKTNSRGIKKIAIVGDFEECHRVKNLLHMSNVGMEEIFYISVGDEKYENDFVGNSSQFSEITNFHQPDEIIFCAKNLSSTAIIQFMIELSGKGIGFKIASPDSESVIGSNSPSTSGDFYMISVNLDGKNRIKLQ